MTLATPVGLDVVTGPGGAIVIVDYNGSNVKVLRPNDAGAPTVGAYDIFPWRGRMNGTVPFVIGGVGFGTLAKHFPPPFDSTVGELLQQCGSLNFFSNMRETMVGEGSNLGRAMRLRDSLD